MLKVHSESPKHTIVSVVLISQYPDGNSAKRNLEIGVGSFWEFYTLCSFFLKKSKKSKKSKILDLGGQIDFDP